MYSINWMSDLVLPYLTVIVGFLYCFVFTAAIAAVVVFIAELLVDDAKGDN